MASDKSTHKDNDFYDSGEEDGVGLQAPPKGTKTSKDVQSFRSASKRPRLDESGKCEVNIMEVDEVISYLFTIVVSFSRLDFNCSLFC